MERLVRCTWSTFTVSRMRKALEVQPANSSARPNLAQQLWFKAASTVREHWGPELRNHIDDVIDLLEEAVTFAGTNIERGAVPSLVEEVVTFDSQPGRTYLGLAPMAAQADCEKVAQRIGQECGAQLSQFLEDLGRMYKLRERLRGTQAR